jgi:hypothetical protein
MLTNQVMGQASKGRTIPLFLYMTWSKRQGTGRRETLSELWHLIRFFVCFAYSRLSNFSAIRRLSPLPVTGLQI